MKSRMNRKVQTDRNIPNNKPDNVILDTEKGTCVLIDVEISGDRDTRWFKYDWDDLCVNKSQFVPVIFEPPCMIKKEAEKILKYKIPYNRNTLHVEWKHECDTSDNRGHWNHFKIQKTPD
jgi:hypothetical protein